MAISLVSETMATMQMCKKLLKVAIIGAPNAGKSTLLNRFIGANISCVSNKVHTTRKNVLGVYTQDSTQIEFFDAPGMVTRHHLLKHRLENSLLHDPEEAAKVCDLIAVVIDASNIREQRRLNRGILNVLNDHMDKKSILILNKVDLVKEKRQLLDICTRLSQGCIEGQCTIPIDDLRRMSHADIRKLNLVANLPSEYREESLPVTKRTKHKYVIELESSKAKENLVPSHDAEVSPDFIGFRNFSNIFSISALTEDGTKELREHLLNEAKPVEQWPHGAEYLSNQTTTDVVHAIIRGKVLDYIDQAIPYLVEFKYLRCNYDDMGSLHVNLELLCPERYMIPKVLGERGVTIFRIVEDSRDLISETLGCDVKLSIQVEEKQKRKN